MQDLHCETYTVKLVRGSDTGLEKSTNAMLQFVLVMGAHDLIFQIKSGRTVRDWILASLTVYTALSVLADGSTHTRFIRARRGNRTCSTPSKKTLRRRSK